MKLRLKETRVKRNLSQSQVQESTGISVKRLSTYETETREPDIETLLILADFYGVTIDYLTGRTEYFFDQQNGDYLNIHKFGERIKDFRKYRETSRKELAEKVGLSVAYLTMVENGLKIPKLETCLLLLNALEASADVAFMDSLYVGKKEKSNYIVYKLNSLSSKSQDVILDVLEQLIDSYKKREDGLINSEVGEKKE